MYKPLEIYCNYFTNFSCYFQLDKSRAHKSLKTSVRSGTKKYISTNTFNSWRIYTFHLQELHKSDSKIVGSTYVLFIHFFSIGIFSPLKLNMLFSSNNCQILLWKFTSRTAKCKGCYHSWIFFKKLPVKYSTRNFFFSCKPLDVLLFTET